MSEEGGQNEGELIGSRKEAIRRLVETVGSVLRLYLGERVHAVTLKGLLLKLMMAIWFELSLSPPLLKWQLGLLIPVRETPCPLLANSR